MNFVALALKRHTHTHSFYLCQPDSNYHTAGVTTGILHCKWQAPEKNPGIHLVRAADAGDLVSQLSSEHLDTKIEK